MTFVSLNLFDLRLVKPYTAGRGWYWICQKKKLTGVGIEPGTQETGNRMIPLTTRPRLDTIVQRSEIGRTTILYVFALCDDVTYSRIAYDPTQSLDPSIPRSCRLLNYRAGRRRRRPSCAAQGRLGRDGVQDSVSGLTDGIQVDPGGT